MKMFEPKRLHPISIVVHFIKGLKELIFPFIFLFIFGGSDGPGFNGWQLSFAGIFLIVSLVTGILSWLRYTYRVEDGELRIESGLFVRKKRYIPFDRIQSLDFSEGIFQRPFGLVKVKVETAGSSGLLDAEAVLTAITKADARLIQDVLSSVKNKEHTEVEDRIEPTIIYRITPLELVLLSSTSGGAGVVISAVIAFVLQFDELIPYEKVFNELQGFISNGVMFISLSIFIVFFLAWIIAIIGTMIKYSGFAVNRDGEDLIITRGIIEKRQITIPLHRVQGILISENIIRQPFGLGSVFIESAGGSLEKDGSKILLLPIMKKQKIMSVLSELFEDYHVTTNIVHAPKRSRKRYTFRMLILPCILSIVAIIFFRPWGYLALLLFPLAVVWAYLKHKDAGWSIENQQLTLTYRGIVKNTIFMKKGKIQTLSISKSYFQDQNKLATIEATIKSGIGGSGGTVVDLEASDTLEIYRWYMR